jgi:hypothetical protein
MGWLSHKLAENPNHIKEKEKFLPINDRKNKSSN